MLKPQITSIVLLALALPGRLSDAPQPVAVQAVDRAGIPLANVQHQMAELIPLATFPVEGRPDWMAITNDAVWVASSNVNHVVRLDPGTNLAGTIVTVAEPCSGLASGFGSLWIPSCGDHNLVRVDAETGRLETRIAANPADDEGGIAVGAGSVWIVTSRDGELSRIDPGTNRVVATVRISAGSFNPVYANGFIWVSSNLGGTVVQVDPADNKVLGETAVGPQPRFLAVGDGSLWVLNQGDGTIARIDARTGRRTAVIAAGIPGKGGEIAYGGAVWATVMGRPITVIDPKTNKVIGQWQGSGGDSIRVGHGSLWLTDLKGSKVWRLPLSIAASLLADPKNTQ